MEHKEKRFPRADNQNIEENEAFLLTDPEVKKLYEEQYKKTSSLYYKEQIPFDEIMKQIQVWIKRL